MPGQRPAFRFLVKDQDSQQLHEIGAAWATSKADIFSVALDLEGTGAKINFLMVPADRPKLRPAPASGAKPAA